MRDYWATYDFLLCSSGDKGLQSVKSTRAVDMFAKSIVNDPAYQPSATVEGDVVPLVVSRKAANLCTVKAMPETDLYTGDCVECLGETWLAHGIYADKIGLLCGELWLCNGEVKFQNGSAKIISKKCVIDDGTYSKKSSDPDAFVPTNTYRIYMPIDAETDGLYIDKRIPLGSIITGSGDIALEVYKIVGIDRKSQNHGTGSHIMMLTLQRDVYDPTVDNLLDGICDAYTQPAETREIKEIGSWGILGRDFVRIGTTRVFDAFIDKLQTIPSDIEPLWDIACEPSIVPKDLGTSCSIFVPLDETLVGSVITIRLTDEYQKFGYFEKKVQVISVG